MVIVNGFDARVQTSEGTFPISSQRYHSEVIHPDGSSRLIAFRPELWPRWTYQISEGLFVEQEIFVPQGVSAAVLRWRLKGDAEALLKVRPFLSGRDFHGTHHENATLNFAAEVAGDRVTWNPYPGVLRVTARSNGRYTPEPDWYRNPWFGDWGRDTFVALRGLCLATGRFEDARDILVEWTWAVSEGMLPNRFPDKGETPEFNSVDASLWVVVASHELLSTAPDVCSVDHIEKIRSAIEAILSGYSQGTRFGIRLDESGLLACGVPGVQLTWMDAKVGDWVVTPRIGKPVEVQALWLNALLIGAEHNSHWQGLFDSGVEAFRSTFWNESRRCLFDVIDCDHRKGTRDASLRPNQIFAVGGLPACLLEGEPARAVVDTVEASLLTPKGLRSLAPQEPNYGARYEGDVVHRDGSYHQGTVWPWLIGPFVEAWLRVRGNSPAAAHEARNRFLPPLYEHLNEAGIGHISEITDAEAPHTPRGCPFQAWSLGELLRLEHMVLRPQPAG